MSRYVPSPGLEQRVALGIVRPRVQALGRDVADAARRAAPAGKVWVTALDEKVRHSHRDTDGVEIPGNLRYQLPRYNGRGERQQGVDLGRVPRDPNLPVQQVANCRCESVQISGAIARKVALGDAHVEGTRVAVRVDVEYPRVAESENPDIEDGGGGWLRQSLIGVAARNRTRR